MLVRDNFEVGYERLFNMYKTGSTVWTPLAKGLLTGKYDNSTNIQQEFKLGYNDFLQNILKKWFKDTECNNKFNFRNSNILE